MYHIRGAMPQQIHHLQFVEKKFSFELIFQELLLLLDQHLPQKYLDHYFEVFSIFFCLKKDVFSIPTKGFVQRHKKSIFDKNLSMRTLINQDFSKQRVVVRVDFNVPIDDQFQITDLSLIHI